MLVLSRKVGERIWIGNEICVTVVRLTSGGVRLGIEAPAELAVIREELKVREVNAREIKFEEAKVHEIRVEEVKTRPGSEFSGSDSSESGVPVKSVTNDPNSQILGHPSEENAAAGKAPPRQSL